MPTLDGTRIPQRPPARPSALGARQPAPRGADSPVSGAIDHWSYVLLYSMGVGTLAVAALLFVVLIAVWLYAQFVWTFTKWDLTSVSLTPFKSLAYLVIAGTFVAGTCAGLWIFSGAAWKNQLTNTKPTRRPVR